jgi:hypothetical protein
MVPRIPVRANKNKKARISPYNFDIFDRSLEAPSVTPANLSVIIDKAMKGKLELLRKQFAERPVWCRLALHNTTSITYPELSILLGYVAYTVNLGAFRDLWIRLGDDPRTEPSYYNYQLVFPSFFNLQD